LYSWRTTPLAAEKRLNLVNGILVVFDETRTAKPETVDHLLYQLPMNRGASRNAPWPSGLPWSTVVLSTGEQPALSFTSHQGAAARVLSVSRPPFPGGDRVGIDACAVRDGVNEHFGHAGPSFVQHLRAADEATLRKRHADLIPQVAGSGDLAGRRAPLLAAHVLAGQLAREWGLLPFEPPSATDWQAAFQTAEETDNRGEMALNIVRELVASHGQALWNPVSLAQEPNAGWIGRYIEHERGRTVALLPQQLRAQLARAGYDLDAVLPAWREDGVILRVGDDRSPWTATRKCGASKARLYVFAPGTIEFGDDHDA
jgi:hypothetical protein